MWLEKVGEEKKTLQGSELDLNGNIKGVTARYERNEEKLVIGVKGEICL